jgi:hypothetical protein
LIGPSSKEKTKKGKRKKKQKQKQKTYRDNDDTKSVDRKVWMAKQYKQAREQCYL